MKRKIVAALLVALGMSIYSASAAQSPGVVVPLEWFQKTVPAKDEWGRKYDKPIHHGLTKVCDGTNLVYVFYGQRNGYDWGTQTSSIAVVPGGCRE